MSDLTPSNPARVKSRIQEPAWVAAAAAVVQLVVLLGVRFTVVAIPWWLILVLTGVIAVTTYFAIRVVPHVVGRRRLENAIRLLQQIEHHDFTALDAASQVTIRDPGGDDSIDELEKAIIRTGHALRTEMENLKRVETYRKDYLGNVSHELKTPLFSIRGFAETLLNGAIERPEVRTEFVQKILRNSDRLANLASDLGEIAKIEMGELKMRRAPFQLADLVRDVIDEIEPIAQHKNVRLIAEAAAKLPPVMGDEDRIRQVLVNLVDNGVKYTNEGGHVKLAATAKGASVDIVVSDDGIGVAPEHVQRLTERFYRVDASRSRAQGGTGLGLAIVKHILSAHGQPLRIESRLGTGSSFSFSLPVATSDAALPHRV
jgi:two-component system phosphate regulon sensor histidine kinase PhoR